MIRWIEISKGVYRPHYHLAEALEDCEVDYIDTDNSYFKFIVLANRRPVGGEI